MPPEHAHADIIVIDDEPANVLLLRKVLHKAGYTAVRVTTNPLELPHLLDQGWPDLILLDLNMPGMDGFEVMDLLADLNVRGTFLPVLVLTADANTATRDRALSGGAMDFVAKPFDRTEVLLRIRNLLQTRMLHTRLEEANATLEERVRQRTAALRRAQLETVDKLALAAEYRDDETGHHIRRVGRVSWMIARHIGLEEPAAELIGHAAPLHDLGKIQVPDRVLLKPGRLDPEERAVIRTHTEIGWRLLRDSESPILRTAAVMARHHHDRWDGQGYGPLGGGDIPLEARIVSVADVFDALTHERCYKDAWAVPDAVEAIRAGAGTQFDPALVEAFCDVVSDHATLV